MSEHIGEKHIPKDMIPRSVVDGIPLTSLIQGHQAQANAEVKKIEPETRVFRQATDEFRATMKEFARARDELAVLIADMRSKRMAAVSEIHQALTALRDLRQFFLEDDYREQKARLAEFVGIAERLAALARDGTLDVIADVCLKLAKTE